MSVREIYECVIYTPATRTTHFLLNKHPHTRDKQTKQIIDYLNFMGFPLFGLTFQLYCHIFQFWRLARRNTPTDFSFFYF